MPKVKTIVDVVPPASSPAASVPVVEAPLAPGPAVPYPHQIPRYLHRAGEPPKLVTSIEACEAAFAEGWSLRPKD